MPKPEPCDPALKCQQVTNIDILHTLLLRGSEYREAKKRCAELANAINGVGDILKGRWGSCAQRIVMELKRDLGL